MTKATPSRRERDKQNKRQDEAARRARFARELTRTEFSDARRRRGGRP
jgi:hypothetical protein